MGVQMRLTILAGLVVALALSACSMHRPLTDDTPVFSVIDGVKLTYRYAIIPPRHFTAINKEYRALYATSVLNRPDFSGKRLAYLNTGDTYTVLGQADNGWFAVASQDKSELAGYVPLRALVLSERYADTLKADARRRRTAEKRSCVAVDDVSQACQNNSGTWIIE